MQSHCSEPHRGREQFQPVNRPGVSVSPARPPQPFGWCSPFSLHPSAGCDKSRWVRSVRAPCGQYPVNPLKYPAPRRSSTPPTNRRLSNLTGILFKLREEGLSKYDHPAIRQTPKDGRGCGSTTHLLMLAEECRVS